jgi:hypothetical protein
LVPHTPPECRASDDDSAVFRLIQILFTHLDTRITNITSITTAATTATTATTAATAATTIVTIVSIVSIVTAITIKPSITMVSACREHRHLGRNRNASARSLRFGIRFGRETHQHTR